MQALLIPVLGSRKYCSVTIDASGEPVAPELLLETGRFRSKLHTVQAKVILATKEYNFIVFGAFDRGHYAEGSNTLLRACHLDPVIFEGSLLVMGADATWRPVDLEGGQKQMAMKAAVG